MRDRLVSIGLWDATNPNNPANSFTAARQVMTRMDATFRYRGQTESGDYEYLVYEPRTGSTIATGRGKTAAIAICTAALEAYSLQHH
jgi:hypothetical protein